MKIEIKFYVYLEVAHTIIILTAFFQCNLYVALLIYLILV